MTDLLAQSDFLAERSALRSGRAASAIQRRGPLPRSGGSGSLLAVKRAGSTGFTLLELIVVVAVVGVLASLAASDLSRFIGRYRLNSAAKELASVVHACRMRAISENRECGVQFVSADPQPAAGDWRANVGRYEVLLSETTDTGVVWNSAEDGVHDLGAGVVAGHPGISIESWTPMTGPPSSGLPETLVFSPLGISANAPSDFATGGVVRVILRNKRSSTIEQRVIRVDRGGNVQIAVP